MQVSSPIHKLEVEVLFTPDVDVVLGVRARPIGCRALRPLRGARATEVHQAERVVLRMRCSLGLVDELGFGRRGESELAAQVAGPGRRAEARVANRAPNAVHSVLGDASAVRSTLVQPKRTCKCGFFVTGMKTDNTRHVFFIFPLFSRQNVNVSVEFDHSGQVPQSLSPSSEALKSPQTGPMVD